MCMKMKINKENPWDGMLVQTQRRVDSALDLFWHVDKNGRYSFILDSVPLNSENVVGGLNLRGISVEVESKGYKFCQLKLSLDDRSHWDIFLSLCFDLFKTYERTDNRNIKTIKQRLVHWKSLLENSSQQKLSHIEQMGLFSELDFINRYLIDAMPEKPISHWAGPEGDKHDFSCDCIDVEVKSYKSSKGARVQISSVDQLDITNKPLNLIVYSLTSSPEGLNVRDLAESIKRKLKDSSDLESILELERKLMLVGYSSYMDESLLDKFIVDSCSVYKVDDEFPQIKRSDVDSKIISLNYCIDLGLCDDFKIDNNQVFEG